MNRQIAVTCIRIFVLTIAMQGYLSAQDNVLIVNIRSRPPEMNIDGFHFTGPLIDIIESAARETGYRCKYEVRQFKASLALLKRGKIDILPRTICREDRAGEIDYLGPIGYQKKVISFLVKPGKEEAIRSFEDLKKLTVGVKRGTVYFEEFDTDSRIKKIESYDDDNMVRMFERGRFDTMIVLDKKPLETALKKNHISDYAYAEYVKKIKIGNYYGIAENHKAKNDLQKALENMVLSGEVKAIYNRYGVTPPAFDIDTGFIPCFSD